MSVFLSILVLVVYSCVLAGMFILPIRVYMDAFDKKPMWFTAIDCVSWVLAVAAFLLLSIRIFPEL